MEPKEEIKNVKKLCLYTAVCVDKNHILRGILQKMPNYLPQDGWVIEAHVFTNCPHLLPKEATGWTVHPVPPEAKKLYARKMARYIKLNPEKVLPPCDWSLWVDSRVRLLPEKHPVKTLVFLQRREAHALLFCLPPLSRYKCVYKEIIDGEKRRLDPNPSAFRRQLAHTRKVGVPKNWLCVQTTILYRKWCPRMNAFNEKWWDELNRFTVRDQFSIISVLWQTKIKVGFIPTGYFGFSHYYGDHSYEGGRPRKRGRTLPSSFIKEVKKGQGEKKDKGVQKNQRDKGERKDTKESKEVTKTKKIRIKDLKKIVRLLRKYM